MLSKNIKYLRKRDKISQSEMADKLGLKRTAVGDYERGSSKPSIATLLKLSDFFGVTIDQLIKDKIYNDQHTIINDKNIKVLAITVDQDNNNLIDLVKTKAEAGYLASYNDPEYILDLPKIGIPNIPNGTYRAFEISGDSMLPIPSQSIVICQYIERLEDIKDGKTYVIISKMEGLVYKRVKKDFERERLLLNSDNLHYLPYELALNEVGEIWEYYAHISFSDKKPAVEELRSQLEGLEGYLAEMKKKLDEM